MAAPSAVVTIAGLLSWVRLCSAGLEWAYEGDNGPEHWSRLGYRECDHHHQSPIDIHSSAVVLRQLEPLQLRFFDRAPQNMNVTNTFTGVAVTMASHRAPLVKAGSLPGEYKVVGFHFHWGENDSVGSEHVLDGHSYPLEMHILCTNTQYADLAEASQRPDGLAVLAVWFKVGSTANSGLTKLEPALRRVTAGGTSTLLSDPPSLLQLMPSDTAHFYRYDGSLTTPGCYEVVTWTVFKQPVEATESQIALLRALKGHRRPIGHNYRLIQLTYGRTVFERRALDEPASGGVSGDGDLGLLLPRPSGQTAAGGAAAHQRHAAVTVTVLWLGLTVALAEHVSWLRQ